MLPEIALRNGRSGLADFFQIRDHLLEAVAENIMLRAGMHV